jgi:hypothetical protein
VEWPTRDARRNGPLPCRTPIRLSRRGSSRDGTGPPSSWDDDHDGTLRHVKQAIGDASKRPAGERTSSPASDDDQVCPPPVGQARDRLGNRLEVPRLDVFTSDSGTDSDRLSSRRVERVAGDPAFRLLEGGDGWPDHPASLAQETRRKVPDRDSEKGAAARSRDLGRETRRREGRRGAVRGEQNLHRSQPRRPRRVDDDPFVPTPAAENSRPGEPT